jgi:hypothetical protein
MLFRQLKTIVAHDPTGSLPLKSLYIFSHPAVVQEYEWLTKDHDMCAFVHLRMIQRNLYIVQALIGILEAYVRPFPNFALFKYGINLLAHRPGRPPRRYR